MPSATDARRSRPARHVAAGPGVRLAAGCVALGLAALGGLGAPATSAGPASAPAEGAGGGANEAAVIVQLADGSVRQACVRFDEESITGLEALRRAGLEPLVRAFPGEGPAVCALDGEGCPADESCLVCGGESYWSYHRAAKGDDSYTYSPRGSAVAEVVDGDVEGWRWGPGDPPPLVPACEVCEAAGGAGASAAGDRTAGAAGDRSGGGGGSVAGAASGAALIAVLAGWWWFLRRRRPGAASVAPPQRAVSGSSVRPSPWRAKRPRSRPWVGASSPHGQPPNPVRW